MTSEKHTNLETQCKDLLTKIAELNCMTAAHQKAFDDIVKSIEDTKTEKAEAKKSYQEFLDQGDANKMQAALDRIRKANQRISELTAEITNYKSKVPPLRASQASLIGQARKAQGIAEKLVKETKRQLIEAESTVNAAGTAAGFINDLQNVIQKDTAKKSLT